MSIVVTDWYKGITKAAQLTAKDVYSIVRSSIEDEIKSDEEFAEKHEFYDALPTAFGDDEEEGLEFDWNVKPCLTVDLWFTTNGKRNRRRESLALEFYRAV